MTVSYVVHSYNHENNSGTNQVSLPVGSSAGDVVVLHYGTTLVWVSFSGITGWIEVGTKETFSGWEQGVYYKVLTAGDVTTGSVTVHWSNTSYSNVALSLVTGADPSDPVPASGGTSNSGSGTTSTGLSCSVLRADSLLMHFAVSSSGARNSGPSGMASAYVEDTNMYGDYVSVAPASTGNKTSSYPSQQWLVHMVVFQPPDSPAPGPSSEGPPDPLLFMDFNF